MAKQPNGSKKTPKLTLPNPTPAFDVGFQLQEQNNLENQLGTAAINTETLQEELQNQLDRHLTQAQTNTSMLQTTLQDQLYSLLNAAKTNTGTIHQSLESQLASQMAMPLEATVNLAPQHPLVASLLDIPTAPPSVPQAPSITAPQLTQTFGTTTGNAMYNNLIAAGYTPQQANAAVSAAGLQQGQILLRQAPPNLDTTVGEVAAPITIVPPPGQHQLTPTQQGIFNRLIAAGYSPVQANAALSVPVSPPSTSYNINNVCSTYTPPEFTSILTAFQTLNPIICQWALAATTQGVRAGWAVPVTDSHGNQTTASVGTFTGSGGAASPTLMWNEQYDTINITCGRDMPGVDWGAASQLCGVQNIPPTGVTPTVPGYPAQPQPTPASCPPSQCPPVIKFPDCIKICDTNKRPEQPPQQICKYCLYCSSDKILYIIKETDQPRSTFDTQLACGDPLEWNLQQIVKQCTKPTDQNQYPGTPPYDNPAQPGVGAGCGGLFQFPFLNNPNNFTFATDIFAQAWRQIGVAPSSGSGIIDAAINGFLSLVTMGWGETIDAAINSLTNYIGQGCLSSQQTSIIAMRAILGLARRWVTDAAEGPDTQAAYAQNYNCPWKLPSSEAATQAYLANSIDLDRLQCIVRANGNMWGPWVDQVDAARTRWNPAETIMLLRRNFIPKAAAYDYLRQLGYLSDTEKDGLYKLSEQIPAVSDIISMMLRDVADEVNIDWKTSDDIFVNKYAGQLKDWGDQQGIPLDMAKYLWRAHWRLPSPTQLFEFWQRLRKDGRFGTEAEFYQKIRNVLLQDDYHPDWVDTFMAVATRPLTRIDAGRAYEVGVLSQDQLQLIYNQLGYDDNNAKTLAQYKRIQLKQKWQRSPLLKAYATGELTYQDLDDLLGDAGLPTDLRQEILQYAKKLLVLERRKVCVKGLRKRYLLGEFDNPTAQSKLAANGLDADQALEITNGWDCEKSNRGKSVAASTLCGWYERGAIDEVDLYTRLKNLNYSDDDSAKLTRDCMTRVGIKIDKDRQKELARQIRDQNRAARQAAQLARQFDRDMAKMQAQATKAQKINEDRRKLLIRLSEDYAKKTGLDLADVAIALKAIIDSAIATGLAPINVIYQGAASLAVDPSVIDYQTFQSELGHLLVEV